MKYAFVRNHILPMMGLIMAGALLLAPAAVGCAGGASTASPQTTHATAGQTLLELAAGSYSGDYCFVDPARADVCELTVEVGPEGRVEVTAETREGAMVTLTGAISPEGTLSASGRPNQGDGEITLTGRLKSEGGAVSLEGTWLTTSQESGTWTASKQADTR